MHKIGDEYINVSNLEKILIVYVKPRGLAAPGEILVVGQNSGRKWLSNEQLENEYVEAF